MQWGVCVVTDFGLGYLGVLSTVKIIVQHTYVVQVSTVQYDILIYWISKVHILGTLSQYIVQWFSV